MVILTSVFGDPFDIRRQSLDVEIVVVKVRALLLAEILAACRTLLRIARPIANSLAQAEGSSVRRRWAVAVAGGSLNASSTGPRTRPHHPPKRVDES